jgi:acyl carrier protein
MHWRYPLLLVAVLAMGCSNTNETEIQVRKVIAAQLKTSPQAIDMNRSLGEQKGDALDLVEMVMTLEEKLGVVISDQMIEKYVGAKMEQWPKLTPKQLVRIVEECKASPAKRKQ